jgi:hypothetical protein
LRADILSNTPEPPVPLSSSRAPNGVAVDGVTMYDVPFQPPRARKGRNNSWYPLLRIARCALQRPFNKLKSTSMCISKQLRFAFQDGVLCASLGGVSAMVCERVHSGASCLLLPSAQRSLIEHFTLHRTLLIDRSEFHYN